MSFHFKKYVVLLVVLLTVNLSKAQLGKEAWHWHFGWNASLDFTHANATTKPATGHCAINTNEGSASVSDPNTGQLLFYTDGAFVWDKNNNQMPNGYGLLGDGFTSTQAALIIPKPGSSTIYYLITSDCGGYCGVNKGVNYSIVDMTLNNGLGDVDANNKNIPLTPPPTTEKLTAVRHANCVDYWLLTHPFNSNAFNAYLVTANGINPTPVVSNTGMVQTNVNASNLESIGYLKASPNAKRLAAAIYYGKAVEVYDFDNATGIVSNAITLTKNAPNFYPYGVCFSPDNSKLYISADYDLTFGSSNLNCIYQYDLSSNNAATINASAYTLGCDIVISGALQLAPDKKLYAINGTQFLSVISNPNNLGASCNYGVYGNYNFTNAAPALGLPNFIDANNYNTSQTSNISLCSFTNYTLSAGISNGYHWSTGDTTQNIIINNFGKYWVSYTGNQGCHQNDTFFVQPIQPPAINILRDTFTCGSIPAPIVINATNANTASYLWNDGFTSPVHTITNPGTYWVDFTLNNFCISRDSFSDNLFPALPPITLGDDAPFCLTGRQLSAYTPLSTYLWSTGETTPSIIVTHPGTYSVQINYRGCKNYDSITILPNYNLFNFVLPNIITPNNDGINDFIDFSQYQFFTLQLDIYNRWGHHVFQSNDPRCIWKPTDDDGTYFLVLNYQINCGTQSQQSSLKQFITIAR